MVGRALILTDTMTKLPSPAGFDPEQHVRRFNWLVRGTIKECLEIHGGCGFSRKLLHHYSLTTYCAARLQQDRDSLVVPVTAEYLHNELAIMRQWSGEAADWETINREPPLIECVRQMQESYTIDSPVAMTELTAEAWRLAALVYLQCRLLRSATFGECDQPY